MSAVAIGSRLDTIARKADDPDRSLAQLRAWEHGGTTAAGNLAHLCRGHHRLKHNSAWSARHDPDRSGTLHWTSPLGAAHTTKPPDRPAANLVVQQEWLTGDDPPF